jgi:hypothetical protein
VDLQVFPQATDSWPCGVVPPNWDSPASFGILAYHWAANKRSAEFQPRDEDLKADRAPITVQRYGCLRAYRSRCGRKRVVSLPDPLLAGSL